MVEEKRTLIQEVGAALSELVTPFDGRVGDLGTGYWGGIGYNSFSGLFDGD